ncbi:MAG: sigma-54-dependent transcriptional regulator [bacterium]
MAHTTYPEYPVLIIDDEEQFLFSAEITLHAGGINQVNTCRDSRQVLARLAQQRHSVVVLDLYLPHLPGKDLLPQIVEAYPEIPVIVLTAINEVETAVECMKAGAFEYVVKPVDDARLVTTIRHALQIQEIKNENDLLKKSLLSEQLRHPEAFDEIITKHAPMRGIFKYIEAISPTPLPVLVTGETGVGKELVAKAIHRASGRPGEFVAVNVAGVDDALFSDTLFGHLRGAFTGADRLRRGLIEQAANGTLFLDEIGDLSAESQVKLLRLLQEGRYYPLGSDMPKISGARLVAATHQDLAAKQSAGTFRKDLFYRLQAHHIHLPPLRERLDDLTLLIDFYLEKAARLLNKKHPTAPRELVALLRTYHFPGNIRELEGMIFDAVSRHDSGVLAMQSFREKISQHAEIHANLVVPHDEEQALLTFSDRLPTLERAEQLLIEEALRRSGGNQSIASSLLGLSRRALNNRLRREERDT